MKHKFWIPFAIISVAATLVLASFLGIRASYPRPFLNVVAEQPVDENLVYAIMKAESGFDEQAQSRAGAVGIMQLMPSTAAFICERTGMEFVAERLFDGEYNTALGCCYLLYLLEQFEDESTAVAAYNAGEGTVRGWLKNAEFSADGRTLFKIPYPETNSYVKKVTKFKKIYEIMDR